MMTEIYEVYYHSVENDLPNCFRTTSYVLAMNFISRVVMQFDFILDSFDSWSTEDFETYRKDFEP